MSAPRPAARGRPGAVPLRDGHRAARSRSITSAAATATAKSASAPACRGFCRWKGTCRCSTSAPRSRARRLYRVPGLRGRVLSSRATRAASSTCRSPGWTPAVRGTEGQPMAILIDRTKRVLVQGITGREGMARAQLMSDYGTQVVAGVHAGQRRRRRSRACRCSTRSARRGSTPGRSTSACCSFRRRWSRTPRWRRSTPGVKLLVIVPDRVPIYDVLRDRGTPRNGRGAHFVGPNTLGVLSPDAGVLGMIGGRADSARQWFFQPGRWASPAAAAASRPAWPTTSREAGIGASTIVHVGGDRVVGTAAPEIARLFEHDPADRSGRDVR